MHDNYAAEECINITIAIFIEIKRICLKHTLEPFSSKVCTHNPFIYIQKTIMRLIYNDIIKKNLKILTKEFENASQTDE